MAFSHHLLWSRPWNTEGSPAFPTECRVRSHEERRRDRTGALQRISRFDLWTFLLKLQCGYVQDSRRGPKP
jgi:hypothetical protein